MRSLTAQTTLALMTGLLAVLLAQTAFIAYYNYGLMMRTASDKVRTVISAQADNIAVALWNFDYELMQTQVDGLSGIETILAARIINANKTSDPIASSGIPFESHDGAHIVSAPLIYTNADDGGTKRDLGRLELLVEYAPVEMRLRNLILTIVGVTGFVFGILGFIFYNVLKRSILPVNKLSNLMSHGDALNRPLHELDDIQAGTEEVGRLVGAFKLLQGQFFDNKNKLIQAKEEAENSRAQAERANKAKTEFLANMSHELRTPLNSILGLTQMLKETEPSEDRLQMLKTVEISSENLLSIVNDILDISKIESSSFELERVSFNPRACIENVVRALRVIAQKKDLLLQADIKLKQDLNMIGDPKYFTQIVTNLVANAIKYTEKGSVTIVAFQNDAIVEGNKRQISVDVHDTGIGIPADRVAQIFDKFVQADASTTRKYGGSGLGLAITKNLTEMMGGKIKVESVPGAGSTFSIRIPFEITKLAPVTMAVQDTSSMAHTGTLPAAQARILVAEDHELNQYVMRKILPAIGLPNFKIVDNGQLALDAVKAGEVDVILMDCHMPVLSGYDAAAAIRKMEQDTGEHIPIVAITANALAGERENCLNHGMDDYTSKPIDKQKLAHILSRWIAFDAPSVVIEAPKPTQTPAILDLSGIKKMADGDKALEREVLRIFVDESAVLIDTLAEHCADGPNENWCETAHTLKGSAATAGAFIMRDLCARAQSMAGDHTAEERLHILNQIRSAFDEARQEVSRVLAATA